MESFILISAFIVVAITYYYKKCVAPYKHIPGPPILPILGNALEFLGGSNSQNLATVFKFSQQYRPFWKLLLGPSIVFVILEDPKDVEVILSSQKTITKSNDYDIVKCWLQDGLLMSTGPKWFARRKIITPTFHFKILEQFVEVFDRQGKIFMDCLAQYKGKGAFDVFPYIANYALDVISETAMGLKLNAQNGEISEYVKSVKKITNIFFIKVLDYSKRNEFLYRFSKMYQNKKKLLKILHNFTDNVIRTRREELLNQNNNNQVINENMDNVEEVFGAKKKIAFLDLLLQSTIDGKPLSDSDIREEVDTFMFEGHDTTTSAIAFAIFEIARHPEVQTKCFEEICRIAGENTKRTLTIKDLNDLHYMELVIKETLRLYPSVPLFGRKATEDIDVNGKLIPKGSDIIFSPYFMGRNSEYFNEPEKFIPERFESVDNEKWKNPFLFIPFSAGPRNCIGQKFAMYEMKSTLSKILTHYELSVPNKSFKPILSGQLVLRPENGVEIAIIQR